MDGDESRKRLEEMLREPLARARAHLGTERGEHAFAEVVDLIFDSVYRIVLRRLKTRHAALEVTGTTLLNAQIRLDRYDPARPFLPWVHVIARNAACDFLRRENHSRAYKHRLVMEEFDPTVHDVPAAPAATDLEIDFKHVLATLSSPLRRVAHLRITEDRTAEDVALIMGKSVSWVYRRLEELREALAVLR